MVLGYHGCSLQTAYALLSGAPFAESVSSYDWLGRGAYFWEDDPLRAFDWARARFAEQACVVGAVLELGRCLDLTRQSGLRAVKAAHQNLLREYVLDRQVAPVNEDPRSGVRGDLALRHLDRAVIDYLNGVQDRVPGANFQTVRALYPEGEPLYPGAGFRELTHVQVCVREPKQIMGVFRVPEHQRVVLGMPPLYEPGPA